MKILYLVRQSEIGGAENSLFLLLKYLNKKLFQPTVVLPSKGPLYNKLTELRVETVIIPLHKLKSKNPLPYLTTVARLTRLIKVKRIDIVHCNVGICNQFALPAARLCGIPILCHIRREIEKKAFQRMFLTYADVLIAISQNVAYSLDKYTKGSPRIVVIHNGVDLNEFLPCTGSQVWRKQRLEIYDDTFLIGLFGRIVPEKGHHVMIRALGEIAKMHPNSRLIVAGGALTNNKELLQQDNTFLCDLKKLVREMGLTKKVIFTGFVGDMVPLYECLDVLVVPSLDEACGRTAFEAMAMKKPIVASDVGPAREVVEDGRTALLVPPNDPDQLAAAILKLIRNKVFTRKLGENGRLRVEKYFTIKEHVRNIEKFYKTFGINCCSTVTN